MVLNVAYIWCEGNYVWCEGDISECYREIQLFTPATAMNNHTITAADFHTNCV